MYLFQIFSLKINHFFHLIIEFIKVKFATVKEFIRSCSYVYVGLFLGLYLMMYTCQGAAGLWLSEWSNLYLDYEPGEVDKGYYLLIYALIGVGQR